MHKRKQRRMTSVQQKVILSVLLVIIIGLIGVLGYQMQKNEKNRRMETQVHPLRFRHPLLLGTVLEPDIGFQPGGGDYTDA